MEGTTPVTLLKDTLVLTGSSICPFRLINSHFINNDESSDDEDTKLKSYITRQFKKFIKNANVKAGDKDRNNLHSLNSSPKTKVRENSRMLVKTTMFQLDQSAIGVKDLDI